MRKSYNLLAILNAFQLDVWLVLLLTIPTYITVMVMANWFHLRQMKWEMFASFVIRTTVMESRCDWAGKRLPTTRINQKLLILFWSLPLFVLVTAYTGNMTALITNPSLQQPIKDVKELVNQNQMPWLIQDGASVIAYLKSKPTGTYLIYLILQSYICMLYIGSNKKYRLSKN